MALREQIDNIKAYLKPFEDKLLLPQYNAKKVVIDDFQIYRDFTIKKLYYISNYPYRVKLVIAKNEKPNRCLEFKGNNFHNNVNNINTVSLLEHITKIVNDKYKINEFDIELQYINNYSMYDIEEKIKWFCIVRFDLNINNNIRKFDIICEVLNNNSLTIINNKIVADFNIDLTSNSEDGFIIARNPDVDFLKYYKKIFNDIVFSKIEC